MYVHIESDAALPPGQDFKIESNIYPAKWLEDPAMRTRFGIVELTRVDEPPADAENYYRTETRTGAVATAHYVRKSDEQIAQANNARIDAHIAALESQQLMPRAVREYLLAAMVERAAASGLTEPQLYAANVGYRKAKDFNATIAGLRSQKI